MNVMTVNDAAVQLQYMIAQRQPMRCMGCLTLKRWNPEHLHVVGYTPKDPKHWPCVYVACNDCMADTGKRKRLFQWAETRSRECAEEALHDGVP